LEGNIISMNKAGLGFVGYSREELINHSFVPLVSEKDLDRTLSDFKKAKDGAFQEYEIMFIHKEGHSLSCLIKNIPILIDGKIKGIFSIAKNITTEKTLLKSLKESEERHRLLVDNSPDPMFIHHEDFIEYANNAAVRLLEVSDSGQLIGKSIYDFSPIKYRDSIRERNREFIEEDSKLISQEEEIITVQGRKIDVEVTAISTIYKGRTVIHSVVRDISERKLLEEALQESEERSHGLP
jgi:two-component system sporulation sensor kinase A